MHKFDLDTAADYTAPGIENDADLDDEGPEDAPVRAREGLPTAFRMRHTPHYVEQLMGEGPLQTVRQIPLAEIHGGPLEGELAPGLVASIREIGLVQPLLVAADGPRRFELLAGAHRLAAAHEAGLASVPCLVQTADAPARAKIRQAARQRRPEPKSPAPVPAPAGDAGVLVSAFAEIADTLSFVNGLAPFASGQEPVFRTRVLNDLMRLETQRATVLASAASMLTRRDTPAGEAVDCAAIAGALRTRIELEARYRGAALEWSDPPPQAIADADGLGTAWACTLHALLALARPGSRLHVSARVPRVRPALIVEATLTDGIAIANAEQLVDREWAEHPGGPSCALMLTAAAHCARMHRGRLGLSVTGQGLTVTFVVPQPLDAGHGSSSTGRHGSGSSPRMDTGSHGSGDSTDGHGFTRIGGPPRMDTGSHGSGSSPRMDTDWGALHGWTRIGGSPRMDTGSHGSGALHGWTRVDTDWGALHGWTRVHTDRGAPRMDTCSHDFWTAQRWGIDEAV